MTVSVTLQRSDEIQPHEATEPLMPHPVSAFGASHTPMRGLFLRTKSVSCVGSDSHSIAIVVIG